MEILRHRNSTDKRTKCSLLIFFFFFFKFWENSIGLCLLLFTQTYKRHGKSAAFRDHLIQQHGISSVDPRSLTPELTHTYRNESDQLCCCLGVILKQTVKPHPHKPHTVMFIPSTLAEQLHLIHIIHTFISYVNLHLFFPFLLRINSLSAVSKDLLSTRVSKLEKHHLVCPIGTVGWVKRVHA